jgi:FAD synthetase
MLKKVMVFGTFDPLHKGHLNYFEQAKKHGNYLVVVVARDETIRKGKNREPSKPEKERIEKIRELEVVDKVLLGYKGDKLQIVKQENPDILCLGYDQKVCIEELRERLKKLVLKPEIKRMKPFKPEKYKSSIFRNNFRN